MDVLPIVLFLLGVVFLFLGWRWQNIPDKETLTALKGLAYLKKEIVRVQDQVTDLEGKLLESKQENYQEITQEEPLIKGNQTQVLGAESKEFESRQFTVMKNVSLDAIYSREKHRRGVELKSQLSPKYQEVLELAAGGERIPDIAQRLLLSQDAVSMVLRMQPNGGNKS